MHIRQWWTNLNLIYIYPRQRDPGGTTWLLSKLFPTRPTVYIQGFSWYRFQLNIFYRGTVFCTWCRGPPARKSLPTTGTIRAGIRWSDSSKPRLRVVDLSPISHWTFRSYRNSFAIIRSVSLKITIFTLEWWKLWSNRKPWKTRDFTVKAREKPVILSDFSVANIFKKTVICCSRTFHKLFCSWSVLSPAPSMENPVEAALRKARDRAARATSKLKGSNDTPSGPHQLSAPTFNDCNNRFESPSNN